MSSIRLGAVCVALTCLAMVPSSAYAETAATPSSPVGSPSAPVVSSPAAGRVELTLQKVSGSPLFALVGRRIVVRGIVKPYVAGQSVSVSFAIDGRQVARSVVSVLALGNGAGQFRVGFASRYAGLAQARVTHPATAQQVAFSARAPAFRFVHADLGLGARSWTCCTTRFR